MALSSFLDRFNEPETLRMAQLGRELRARGIDVIDMSLGEPDFDTPDHIKQAAITAIQENWTHYTPVAGLPDLRQAVCHKLKRDNHLDYLPEQIVVSTGAKQSLANVILSLVDEGQEVIIPTPYWVTYSELVKIARGRVVEIRTTPESGFKISPRQLRDAMGPSTKVFMFSSPCNPSGAVYSWPNSLQSSKNIPMCTSSPMRSTSISILWGLIAASPLSLLLRIVLSSSMG
jgi:aspartate aminotransferase